MRSVGVAAVLLVGAAAMPLHAQVPSAVPDSALQARADSIAQADSIKRPLPQAELPARTEGAFTFRFAGDSLFVNGALTVADLLERVPGLTIFRTRFYVAPMVAAMGGDVGRVRLFADGVELESFDPRSGGIPDLSIYPVGSLEELVVERAADEVRVHMRTWRAPNVLRASSRLDLLTGDDRANTFRGYVARRWRPGWAAQLMIQQRSLLDTPVIGGDGDALSAFARLGYVGRGWSVDATLNRRRNTRTTLLTIPIPDSDEGRTIPGMELTEQELMLRAAVGEVSRGPWLQVSAVQRRMIETSPRRTAAGTGPGSGVRVDTADTNLVRQQYVIAGGISAGALRLSATHRIRSIDGTLQQQPSLRAAFETRRATLAFFGERTPFDEVTRGEVHGRLQPVPWLLFQGTATVGTTGRTSVIGDTLGGLLAVDVPAQRAIRAEAGVKLGGLWVTGGILSRDSALLRPPILLDQRYPAVVDGPATAITGTIVGPVWRGFTTHVHGVQWEEAGAYRPRRQVRAELAFQTDWRSRFPSGNFGLRLGGTFEYRDRTAFPLDDTVLRASSAGIGTVFLELRLRDATLSWQLRNPAATTYSQVPGLLAYGPINIYGVRWTFWN